jgi:hypothetical protein
MTASPSDVARFTNDGVLVTMVDPTVLQRDANALDVGDSELETFFDSATDASTMMARRSRILFQLGRPHVLVEVEDTLGVGNIIALTPRLPRFTAIDETRSLNTTLTMRSLAFDWTSDRYAVELVETDPPSVGSAAGGGAGAGVTFDGTILRFDRTLQPTFDRTLI